MKLKIFLILLFASVFSHADSLVDLANKGEPESQFRLGLRYQSGVDAEKKPELAAFWYKKSAEQGYADAQHQLAVLYELGDGVEQDYDKAIFWYKKSGGQGNEQSYLFLGDLYREGNGVKRDYTEAAKWYNKAASMPGLMPSEAKSRLRQLEQERSASK